MTGNTYSLEQVMKKNGEIIATKELYSKDQQSTTVELLLKYLMMDMVSFDQYKVRRWMP